MLLCEGWKEAISLIRPRLLPTIPAPRPAPPSLSRTSADTRKPGRENKGQDSISPRLSPIRTTLSGTFINIFNKQKSFLDTYIMISNQRQRGVLGMVRSGRLGKSPLSFLLLYLSERGSRTHQPLLGAASAAKKHARERDP